ncbi:sensor histidine kinase [Cohnella pontilimi]|uniref:sensor histidine kinase n=1 Tax=Cohnella pontilimi TaxID=2564100 RepID=UPI00145C422B|nr:sensor histidine kinase [Cohnella pontilimi]
MKRFGIFAKMMIMLMILLTPILVLYAISNRTSTTVLTQEIMKVKRNQIESSAGQLNQLFAQFDSYKKMLYESTDVRNLAYPDLLGDDLLQYHTLRTVSEEINRLAGYGNWKAVIAVVYPKTGMVIRSNSNLNALPELLPDHDAYWDYRRDDRGSYFIDTFSYPDQWSNTEQPDIRVVVKVDETEIMSQLTELKSGGFSDPILFLPDADPIYNYSANRGLIRGLRPALQFIRNLPDGEQTFLNADADGNTYQIHFQKIESLGWYLVDYIPISRIMKPINRDRTMFYSISGMMLFMAVCLSFLLYRNIRIPFRKLLQSMNLIEKGIYSSRMRDRPPGEFRILYDRFNAMAERIEDLIEVVLKEQIQSKEANLKHLQSQINPHFLYNTLAYIKSMIELGEKEAAIAMTMSLSKYYRYTTKSGKKLATVREELELVSHYLQIHRSLTDSFEFEFEMDDRLLDLEVPRLILQPLVENVVLHAFKNNDEYGIVRIVGRMDGDAARLSVEDNGPGMPLPDLDALQTAFRSVKNEEIESGLLNVHRRMQLLFGDDAGLRIMPSDSGGVAAELRWTVPEGNGSLTEDGKGELRVV